MFECNNVLGFVDFWPLRGLYKESVIHGSRANPFCGLTGVYCIPFPRHPASPLFKEIAQWKQIKNDFILNRILNPLCHLTCKQWILWNTPIILNKTIKLPKERTLKIWRKTWLSKLQTNPKINIIATNDLKKIVLKFRKSNLVWLNKFQVGRDFKTRFKEVLTQEPKNKNDHSSNTYLTKITIWMTSLNLNLKGGYLTQWKNLKDFTKMK